MAGSFFAEGGADGLPHQSVGSLERSIDHRVSESIVYNRRVRCGAGYLSGLILIEETYMAQSTSLERGCSSEPSPKIYIDNGGLNFHYGT